MKEGGALKDSTFKNVFLTMFKKHMEKDQDF